MDLAKPGLIQHFCRSNAMMTFKEYLMDYASPQTKEVGDRILDNLVEETGNPETRKILIERLGRIEKGERDLFI